MNERINQSNTFLNSNSIHFNPEKNNLRRNYFKILQCTAVTFCWRHVPGMYYIVNYYEKSWGHVLRNTLGLSITVNDIRVHAKTESISPQIFNALSDLFKNKNKNRIGNFTFLDQNKWWWRTQQIMFHWLGRKYLDQCQCYHRRSAN